MVKRKQKSAMWLWMVVVLGVLALCTAAIVLLWKPDKQVANFQECKDAGGAIMESYPEQCMFDGKSFTNTTQVAPKPKPKPEPEPKLDTTKDGKYVGLSEKAALDKAKAAGKSARIVERDGVYLPVDASFQPGRLSFHVKDGKIYLVHIEGEEG